jgi:hypothetical protein
MSRAVAGLACFREKYLPVYQRAAFPEACVTVWPHVAASPSVSAPACGTARAAALTRYRLAPARSAGWRRAPVPPAGPTAGWSGLVHPRSGWLGPLAPRSGWLGPLAPGSGYCAVGGAGLA